MGSRLVGSNLRAVASRSSEVGPSAP